MCIACVHCSYIERQLYVYNNEKTVHVHFITLTLSQHQISRIHKSMRNIRYNTCTANMIYVHMLLSLRMLYVVYVAHVVSPLTHPHYILNMYTCITPIFNGNLFYANAVALILKMSLYYLTYEYDCKVELYILCDIADFQYYYINIDYTNMNINVNTIFTCFTVHVHIIGKCQFFSYSTLTRLLCLCKGGSRGVGTSFNKLTHDDYG